MAELLEKYAGIFLSLAEVIKRRLDKDVEWCGVICYRKWLTALGVWVWEGRPYLFASKIVTMARDIEVLQPSWVWGTHLAGSTVQCSHFHCVPLFSWVVDTLLIPKQIQWANCGVPETELAFTPEGWWERQTPMFWEYQSNLMNQFFTLWLFL